MKKILLLLFSLYIGQIAARVVINEVCYDPEGTDEHKEWLELYNAGTSDVDLAGSRIYYAGSSYQLAYSFSHFILRPGRFVLLGGLDVPHTHFTCNLSFQNGGEASDAICFVNADSSYTDTVIYDQPNTNNLPDDSGLPAVQFAPDVPSGYSLARVADGYDSDNCLVDFCAEANPSPGTFNNRYVDYGLSSARLEPYEDQQMLSFYVCNRSAFSSQDFAELKIWQMDSLLQELSIEPILPWDSLLVQVLVEAEHVSLQINLVLPHDPNSENDHCQVSSIALELAEPIINEVFAAPLSGKQEWLEVYQEAVPRTQGSYVILDAVGNRSPFTLPAYPGYFVLCSDSQAFLQDFPDCPSSRVIQCSPWASLNNSGDELYLFCEDLSTLIDSMSYTASQIQSGKSLERHVDEQDNVIWKSSVNPLGASPAQENTMIHLPDQEQRLLLSGSPLNVHAAESLVLSFSLPDDPSRVSCSVFDLAGRKVASLADNQSIPARGYISWDGRIAGGRIAPRGLYIILWESQAAGGGRIYRKQLSAVVQ